MLPLASARWSSENFWLVDGWNHPRMAKTMPITANANAAIVGTDNAEAEVEDCGKPAVLDLAEEDSLAEVSGIAR
nr:hypothetical protein CPGR_00024 [Mycolicibacter nonchromogenicus]